MKASKYIPREHFNLWYSLFKNTSGRLLFNPLDGDKVYVYYEFESVDDCNDFETEFIRLTTPIVETNRSYWVNLKNRILRKVRF